MLTEQQEANVAEFVKNGDDVRAQQMRRMYEGLNAFRAKQAEEKGNAKQQPGAGEDDGGSRPRPAIRQKGRRVAVRRQRVQPGGHGEIVEAAPRARQPEEVVVGCPKHGTPLVATDTTFGGWHCEQCWNEKARTAQGELSAGAHLLGQYRRHLQFEAEQLGRLVMERDPMWIAANFTGAPQIAQRLLKIRSVTEGYRRSLG